VMRWEMVSCGGLAMSQRRPSWVDRYLLRKRKGIRKGENHMRFLACTYDNTYSNVGLVAVYKRFIQVPHVLWLHHSLNCLLRAAMAMDSDGDYVLCRCRCRWVSVIMVLGIMMMNIPLIILRIRLLSLLHVVVSLVNSLWSLIR